MMTALKFTTVWAAALSLLAGCGSSGERTTVTNPTMVTAIGVQAELGVAALVELAQPTTLESATRVEASLGDVWRSAFSVAMQGLAAKQAPQGRVAPLAHRDAGTACVTSSNGGYSHACADLNGTIGVSAGTLTVNLAYTQAGTSSTFLIQGAVTTTPTTVNGALTFTVDFTSEGTRVQGDFVADYQRLTLQSTGCASAGAVVVTSACEVSAGGRSASVDSMVTVEVGPTCGAYSVVVR